MNRLLALIGTAALCAGAQAQITTYQQDFEGYDAMSGSVIGDDGWLVGANVFEADGTTFIYNYFSFPAPNSATAFCNVASGEGGVDQGAQQLAVFNDYDNADHMANPTRVIEANVFREYTIDASNVGQTWEFSYQYKTTNALPGTTQAFIKTIDPSSGFALTNLVTADTSDSTTWNGNTLELTIDAGLVGQLFQIGFLSNASGFSDSGVIYDNIDLAGGEEAQITPYSQDFEGYDAMSPTVIGDDEWLVGANVFEIDGTTFLYNYFSFPAPNSATAFCNVASGEGGPDQGAQQLAVFNDYENTDHGAFPPRVIEANVFREYTIGNSNVGQTWEFSYQYKTTNALPGSALAFIKTIDPANGFAQTNFVSSDTSNSTLWDGDTLSLTIDPGLVGQIFQIGFLNTAFAFSDSGVVYDNINLAEQSTGPSCPCDIEGDGDLDPDDINAFVTAFISADLTDGGDIDGDGDEDPDDITAFVDCFTAIPPQAGCDF